MNSLGCDCGRRRAQGAVTRKGLSLVETKLCQGLAIGRLGQYRSKIYVVIAPYIDANFSQPTRQLIHLSYGIEPTKGSTLQKWPRSYPPVLLCQTTSDETKNGGARVMLRYRSTAWHENTEERANDIIP